MMGYPTGTVMAVTTDARTRLGDALGRILDRVGVKQAELARRTGIPAGRISQWVSGDKLILYPEIEQVEDALEVARGSILAEAGYVEPAASVMRGIAEDPDLEPFDRQYLVDVYDAARRRGREARRSVDGLVDHGDGTA